VLVCFFFCGGVVVGVGVRVGGDCVVVGGLVWCVCYVDVVDVCDVVDAGVVAC